MIRAAALAVFFSALGLGCGSDPMRATDGDPSDETRPPAEVAEAIGAGNGSPGSVNLVTVLEPVSVPASGMPDGLMMPTALDWNPSAPDELWVTLVDIAPEGDCTEANTTGCRALEGRMAIVHGASGSAPEPEIAVDGNSWHFMRRPMGVAFGAVERRQFLSTCGEARTANYTDEEVPYNGPVLWDADRSLFGAPPGPGMNGTHVDMLHSTPYCMGVALEQANVYWAFNGDAGSFDRYDFHRPHEPGGEDHSDGELWRYGQGELARVPNVPSHMAYDARRRLLYVADSGHGRVVALDTTSGYADGEVTVYETIPTHLRMSGATVTEVVRPGTIEMPSGLTFTDGVLFVTDRATSHVFALEPSGSILRELDTGLPPDSLAGISIGPDGLAYITDVLGRRVLRIEKN